MPLSQSVLDNAKATQSAAAHDSSLRVRVVAPPGSGKSFTIEERVAWLLEQGIQPTEIGIISFTRASALDLQLRVHNECEKRGIVGHDQLEIRTMHSLALKLLRKANLLTYPSGPTVLASWEVEEIIDEEFSIMDHGTTPSRAGKIREFREAFWYTGIEAPSNYVPVNPNITPEEVTSFIRFHGPRSQVYCCVLPGEIVQQCVEHTKSGSLDPAAISGLKHLIVDEFQDLNPMDLEFVSSFIDAGVTTFVAGDDDQSVYSLRYAAPSGIQQFADIYEGVGDHRLLECFRCTPSILSPAKSLIERNGDTRRIAKNINSVYSTSSPQLNGVLKPVIFSSGKAEAKAIAMGCKKLITAGLPPEEILILLSNRNALYPSLKKEMAQAGVSYESKFEAGPFDNPDGRFIQAVLRIICDPNDRVALRVLLGTLSGVGKKTACEVAEFCETNREDYLKLFYDANIDHQSTRSKRALERCREICNEIKLWKKTDTLEDRSDTILFLIVARSQGSEQISVIESLLTELPQRITLEELRNFFWMETPRQRLSLIGAVYSRLGIEAPQNYSGSDVQVMSMHGAKGLSATVVFIPGLEEEILPGKWRSPFPSLTAEAARLLYVSITRARIACIMSRAKQRYLNGTSIWPAPSRFCSHLGCRFQESAVVLTDSEIALILEQDKERRRM